MDILDHYGFQQSFTAMMFAILHWVEQGKETDQCATYSFALLFAKIELALSAAHNFELGFSFVNPFGQFSKSQHLMFRIYNSNFF